MTTITHLECSQCGKIHEAGKPHNLCECGGPLLVRYDLKKVRENWNRDWIPDGPSSMWRYAPVLPVTKPQSITSLGEGMTPLIRTDRLGGALGMKELYVKDEGVNPTASFKARGLSCAISMCVDLGIKKVAIPSAGNAGGAMAAYAAAAGLEAHVFMPKDVPQANYLECMAVGAKVTLVDGLISDCGKIVGSRKAEEGWFEVSTLKEPYRIEGKKTMGYEVAEQMRWQLPDVIFYPCGGGVGLIGMWKAFAELEEIGWIAPGKRPKMICVQAAGCQPIVRAWNEGAERSQYFEGADTIAAGLRVPKALGDFLVLRAVRESGGTCIAITDDEMMDACEKLARCEGIFAAPEGGAVVAALEKLLASGFLSPDEKMVLFNTGAGTKYMEAWSARYPREKQNIMPLA
jgi:threonine synthase